MKAFVLTLGLLLLPTLARAEAVVLSGHPVTAGLAQALLRDTGVRVDMVVPPSIPMNRQPSYFAGRGAGRLADAARSADVVVTLRSVWPGDPLFPLARRTNIRLVEIDAARPMDEAMPGLATVGLATTAGDVAPWLAPTNAARMAEIVAADLRGLYPDNAPVIDANLAVVRQGLRAVAAQAARQLALLPDTSVVALSDRFTALAADLGLDVRETLVWDDRAVTSQDLAGLTALLREEAIAVALHHRPPATPIAEAIAAGGARLVVIDPLDSGEPADMAAVLATNLETLLGAFAGRPSP
ncbi:MAG: ABC transporter substrate-binding protein [Rhodospirillaceae bacterium BRH_c57]|nr:MAG: ABC transporter substrate-binding protein [Rhodospirillaceae bacterium BRH_c57]